MNKAKALRRSWPATSAAAISRQNRNATRCWAIAELAERAKKVLQRGEGNVGGMPLSEVLEVIQTLAEAAAGA